MSTLIKGLDKILYDRLVQKIQSGNSIIPVSELGKGLKVSGSSITRRLQKMRDDGFINYKLVISPDTGPKFSTISVGYYRRANQYKILKNWE